MKRFFILFILLLSLSVPAEAFSQDSDYMRVMMEAVCAGDSERGMAAEEKRGEKIAALELSYPLIKYEELELLSKIIEAEAGSSWLSREWKMSVGEVVLNRMASPEFPDSMLEVIEQPGQYYGKDSPFLRELLPSMECVEAAKALLEGERVICDESVVFQANFPLGSGVHTLLYDSRLGYTYLCYSSYPEYYG